MKSHARVGATLASLAAAATAVALVAAPAIAAPAATPAPSRTTLSASSLTVPLGTDAKLKAVVKPVTGTALPTGTVTFSEGATVLGTVSLALVGTSQAAKLTVPAPAVGAHVYTAHYNGSTAYAASTSLPLTVVVGLPGSVTTISATSKNLLPSQSAKLKAVVKPKVAGSGTPSGTVTFSEGTTSLGTSPLALVGTAWTAKLTVPVLALGDHVIVATYNGSASLAPSTSKDLMVTVAKGVTSITVTSAPGKNAGDTDITAAMLPATNPAPTGIVTFIVDGVTSAPQQVSLVFAKAKLTETLTPGSHTVKATYSGDSNYLTSTVTVTITV